MFNESKDDLDDILSRLSTISSRLQSFSQFKNRERLKDDKKLNGLSKDFKLYFYDFLDDDWRFHMYTGDFVYTIRMSKKFESPFNAEEVFNFVSSTLKSIQLMFENEGYNTHYRIQFNGIPQQEVNPVTKKPDIYLYKGYKNKEKYDGDGYLVNKNEDILDVDITFAII
jgi:hypothetical protein